MMNVSYQQFVAGALLLVAALSVPAMAEERAPLDIGEAGHAFEHLGGLMIKA